MLAVILYARAGEPAVTAENKFSDVPTGQWYTNAVIWAAENGIVAGCGDGTFRPTLRSRAHRRLSCSAALRLSPVTT